MLSLEKGQFFFFIKLDGFSIQKVCVGLLWDVVSIGFNVDLDFFVVYKEFKKVVFFNDKIVIFGIKLSDDNLIGEGEGDDEFIELDVIKIDDGDYYICVNIYDVKLRKQVFNFVNNVKVIIYNNEINIVFVSYFIIEDGG